MANTINSATVDMKKLFIILNVVLSIHFFSPSKMLIAQKISCGDYHSLCVCADSSGQAWGSNSSGQLGNGAFGTDVWLPITISSLGSIKSLSGGMAHSLALKADGSVWGWGLNFQGQIGDSTFTDRLLPVPVNALTDIRQIDCGGIHSLYLKIDSTAWGAGQNFYGQLGDGTGLASNFPVMADISQVTYLSAGYVHSLFIKNNDSVYSCGRNDYGQLGDSTFVDRLLPVPVKSLGGVIAVSAGYAHSLALKSDGTVWGWGHNLYGQCGDGSTGIVTYPVQATGLSGVIAIAAGGFHSIALKSDSTVWAWGNNGDGALGVGFSSTVPVLVSTLSGVSSIACGQMHSMMLKGDGTLWACGDNGNGQLGDGTPTDRTFPVVVGTVCIATPLPEYFESFTAHSSHCVTNLTWESFSKNADDFFIVQQSEDGLNFIDLDRIQSVGGKYRYNYYTSEKSGRTFYRIKMLLPDRSIIYSKIIAIQSTCETKTQSLCFPNPTNENVRILFLVSQNAPVKIQLSDCAGKIVLTSINHFTPGKQTVELHTAHLSGGVYFVEISSSMNREYIKLIKEK